MRYLNTCSIIFLMCSVFLFSACTASEPVTDATLYSNDITTSVPPAIETKPNINLEPESVHSPLYNPNYTVDEVITFFCDIALNAEYSHGDGNISLLKKWETPIFCEIHGSYSDADIALLSNMFGTLNTIEGFPGISFADDTDHPNLNIYFCSVEQFSSYFENIDPDASYDGYMTFWYYNDTSVIYDGTIAYREDIETNYRSGIILEELFQLLGFANDTYLYEESVTYQFNDLQTQLADIDIIALKILYSPGMICGMTAEECADVIRQLYY